MDAFLWQLLSSRSDGDIYRFLDQIIQCIHTNTGSRICLLIAERTDTGFVSRQMHAGKNILGHEFAKYFPQLSGEWESFVRSLSESSKYKDDAPLLEEYHFESKNQEKKSQLRKFFHDTLAKKMASKGLKFTRLPWRKLCSDSESYILPGCLPHGFQLKDPELLRVEEVAELWKYIYQHQQSDELTALHFTDEVFKFDRSMRDEVQPEKSKEARVKDRETKGGSRPDRIVGMSGTEVGQQTAAPVKSGNGELDKSDDLDLDQQHPSGLQNEIMTDVVDGEADRPDNVNQRSWQRPVVHEAPVTLAHNTEDSAANHKPSIKRPKRKTRTPYVEDSFEARPPPIKRRRPSAANTEDLDLESESDFVRMLKKKASIRCIDSSSDSIPVPGPQAPGIEDPDIDNPDPKSESEASTHQIEGTSGSKPVYGWKCVRCADSFPPTTAVMHRRICTNMVVRLPFPPNQVCRDKSTNLFTCPKCTNKNKNSDKIREHIKKCYAV